MVRVRDPVVLTGAPHTRWWPSALHWDYRTPGVRVAHSGGEVAFVYHCLAGHRRGSRWAMGSGRRGLSLLSHYSTCL
ncbi:hypothetical protein E2C01_073020 [Portunus trituberculatus]|uniref:Uncharacterized protein n=1 Tax=Portunus trituberculatus TaxID=210409 RepID=A0A5B7I899_PORTR|nr:hypothetical protein [Portunus trituberculatus]